MNALATAADFKNGFGTQFVQPFPDTDALYSSYSHYNNWAAKVPSPLGELHISLQKISTNLSIFPFISRYKNIPMACESTRLCCVNESSSEFDKLLQYGFVSRQCNEYNNAAGFNGIELIRNRNNKWRSVSIHNAIKSIHVSSSNWRASQCYEYEHRVIKIESEATFIGILKSLFNSILIDFASVAFKLWRIVELPICWRH